MSVPDSGLRHLEVAGGGDERLAQVAELVAGGIVQVAGDKGGFLAEVLQGVGNGRPVVALHVAAQVAQLGLQPRQGRATEAVEGRNPAINIADAVFYGVVVVVFQGVI